MQSNANCLPYSKTGYFSPIVLDYISGQDELKPFYSNGLSLDGIKTAISERKAVKTDRSLLAGVMNDQYKNVQLSARQQEYLQQLSLENTFTVCTAHQPNIFTGHLYFIYKLLHTVRLAEKLKQEFPGDNFVPIYYMGSEDADLEELGHIFLNGQKYEWTTDQTGAVGRMKVDKALVQMIETISGQLLVWQFGNEIIQLLKACYVLGETIEQATFKFVNGLFADFGLLILLPDNKWLKQAFIPVIEKELLEGFSHKEVLETVSSFPSKYKVQASGRELNLFYLNDGSRERIEVTNDKWSIVNTKTVFSREEILQELHDFPERFSPNVILRPVFQEMILPNIAFIGGGGELAYWLELKKVFEVVGVPYPILVLRNSFLLIEKKEEELLQKLKFSPEDLFKPEAELMNELVKRDSSKQLSLEKEKTQLNEFFDSIKTIAGEVDVTLAKHADALKAKALQKIETLEKKMLKSEKKSFDAQQRQLHKIKSQLFPNNSLQERVENFTSYYAKYGKDFLKTIYENSLSLEQKFVVLTEK
jgi:bacillithiol biosynthesis cysteine-adding enzyme BshC